AHLPALTIGYDRWRRERVIQPAAFGTTRFDPPCAGKREVAETRIAAIDPLPGLFQLSRKIGCHDIELTVSSLKQELAPAERCKPLAEVGHQLDQRLSTGGECQRSWYDNKCPESQPAHSMNVRRVVMCAIHSRRNAAKTVFYPDQRND